MTMSDRGIHPDLIDEEQASAPAVESPSPPRRGRAAAHAAPPPKSPAPPASETAEPPAPDDATSEPPAPEEPAEPPEWLQEYEKVKDKPEQALALLVKNLPKQTLEQDPTLQGWIGDMGARRARAMLEQQEQQRVEQQKREALANADYYGLGQLTASEVHQQVQQAQASQQFAPFMDAVAAFQSRRPQEVQQQIQGKTYGAGKSAQDGFVEYLEAITEADVSHRLNEAVEKELKRREPALRKAWLSESNGAQPVPELDGGRAASVREITDEQIDRMSLDEYDGYFDGQGHPKPGVRVRLTRGIPLQRR